MSVLGKISSDIGIIIDQYGKVIFVDDTTGRAYVVNSDVSYDTSFDTDIWPSSGGGGGGISLTDLSVTVNSASGGGSLTYNNTTGAFAYTPPDLSTTGLPGATTTAISSGTLTVDMSKGVVAVAHNQNIDSLVFSNVENNKLNQTIVVLTQDGTGGRTITSGGYATADGLGLDIDTTANSVNIITFLTTNGSTIYGFSNGRNFS